MKRTAAALACAIALGVPFGPVSSASPTTCVTYLPGFKVPTPPPNVPAVTSAAVQQAIREGTAAAQNAGMLSPGISPGAAPSTAQMIAQMKANGMNPQTQCATQRVEVVQSPAPGGTGDAAKIYAAALAFYGTDTKAMFGARGAWGVESCMLSVNQIIYNALGFYLANDTASVPIGVTALLAGAGYQISQGQAMPGDIAVADGEGHIGICLDVGCHTVLSNSSSHHAFIWKSDANFTPSYSGPSTFYRIA